MHLWAVSLQVLGVEDALGGVSQQLREGALALDEPRSAQIKPIEMEQVERVIEQPVLAAGCEIGVQRPEIGDAARVCDDGLAVQDQVFRGEGRKRIGDRLEAQRPVVA